MSVPFAYRRHLEGRPTVGGVGGKQNLDVCLGRSVTLPESVTLMLMAAGGISPVVAQPLGMHLHEIAKRLWLDDQPVLSAGGIGSIDS